MVLILRDQVSWILFGEKLATLFWMDFLLKYGNICL